MSDSLPFLADAVSEIDFGLDLRPAAPLLPGEAFHRELARLRAAHRLAPVRFGGAVLPMVTRFEDLDAAFRDDEKLPAGPTYAMTIEPCQGVTFESVDGSEHHALRQLTTRKLRRRPIAKYAEEELPAIAHRVIDAFAARGQADLVREFTAIFPFLVFGHRMGLPGDDAQRFMDWAFDILSYPLDHATGRTAAAALTEYTEPILAARRGCPADDMLSSMATTERDGRRLTDEEILSHVRALFAAGSTTSHHGLGNTLFAVLRDADAVARLRAEPEQISLAVDEMLRWEPPLGLLPRLAPKDAMVAGREVPAGTLLLFGIASANRDPAAYENPDRFDLDRRPQRLLTFGFGSHYCPGSHLARAQISAGLRALLDRLPDLRLADPDAAVPWGTVMRGPRTLPVRFSPN